MLTNAISAPRPSLTKGRNYGRSSILGVIDIDIYFWCYSYKFMSQELMSRLKYKRILNLPDVCLRIHWRLSTILKTSKKVYKVMFLTYKVCIL